MPEIQLESKRLILRPVTMEDVDAMHEMFKNNDDITQTFKTFASKDKEIVRDNIACSIELYEKDERIIFFVIIEKEEQKIIGGMFAFGMSSFNTDINAFIDKAYRRKGYCVEATKLFLRYIRDQTGYTYAQFTILKEKAYVYLMIIRAISKPPVKESIYQKEGMNCVILKYDLYDYID